MSNVSPIHGPHAIPLTQGKPGERVGASAPGTSRQADQADISAIARFRSQISALPDVRQELVDRVRQELKDGTYVTDAKLTAATDALAEDLA